MARVNRLIELLEQDQPTFGARVPDLTHEAGVTAARTPYDYLIVEFEHEPFDTGALRVFMRGLVDGGPTRLRFATRTFGNPTVRTPATQGMCLTLAGDAHTVITGTVNGNPVAVTLGDLASGSVAGYLGAFLAPAYHFHRPVRSDEFRCAFACMHRSRGATQGWYTVRVRQRNEQWAWSSPIWVEAAPGPVR